MGEVSGGPGPPWRQKSCRTGGGISRWTLLLFFQVFLLFGIGGVSAEKNKLYAMQSLCKNHFLQQLYRKIDGAVLWSQNERNLDCIITFQTHSILQRFMLRFDLLQLDCNDHLYIYDGAHAVGTYKADLSCRSTKKSVGSLFTRTNFVTLKYVTDGWGTDSNGFRLVITAVKDPKHACKDFRCNLREFCIATDLVCDNIDHCSDGSDESSSALCQNTETSTVLGLELTWFVVAVVSAVLVLCACGVATAVCVCRRGASARLQHPAAQQPNACSLQQMYGSNGAMKHTAGGGNGSSGGGTSAVTTLPPGGTYPTSTLVKVPGNWPHPAGLLGYRSISNTQARVRLYCQLEK